jgi:NAD(P)-dependent dehydrogenase (short-subunit alcohol dehydrogenase family)
MGELTGRVALVTGAARGIGAASARALAAAGAEVIVTDVLDTQDVAAEIGGIGRRLDVTDEADWKTLIDFVMARTGGLDILVNNAGIFFRRPFMEITLQEWRRLYAINVEGVFLGCKYSIPALAARAQRSPGGASIINMSSAGGLRGGPTIITYSSAKAAVRLMTKGLALELARQRIRVNSVHPGLIETAMGEQVIEEISAGTGITATEARRQLHSAHALGHAGTPNNIADGVVFLSSDRSSFITGTELVIDGGMTA